MDFQELWDSCAQSKASEISENALSRILRLLCAEQDVGNLKKCTFRNSGTPVRRTRGRKSQQMHLREFWDSCAQNKTSEISTMHFQEFCNSCAQNKTSEISNNGLSGILGLLCAEQDVGNLKNCTFWNSGTPVRSTERRKSQTLHFQEFRDSCSQNKTSEISNTTLSGILRVLCAEQNVGNLKKWTFRNYGTPVRRTKRRKFQQMQF